MNRLRNKLKGTPIHNMIIKKRFIHHQQPFLFQYHNLKLEFVKKFPTLINYLRNVHNIPKNIFENSNRISQAKATDKETKINEKQNYAVELAKLAAAITKDNKQRHQIIEDFMLINDTATVAVEIPVYLNNLTGHIDILQIRYHKIYILDYKPTPVNKKQTINQLKLYRKALSKRTNIPEHKFKLAFFNDKGYYELNPCPKSG
jgi:predicted RecB family nuclease